MGDASRVFESALDCGARVLMPIAAAAALGWPGAAGAQSGPEFAYDACEFLPAAAAGEGPDYGVVDAMIEAPSGFNGRVIGALRHRDPICISQARTG